MTLLCSQELQNLREHKKADRNLKRCMKKLHRKTEKLLNNLTLIIILNYNLCIHFIKKTTKMLEKNVQKENTEKSRGQPGNNGMIILTFTYSPPSEESRLKRSY